MTEDGAQRWLRMAALVVAGFGGAVALAAHPVTAAPTVLLGDLILWPLDGAETGEVPLSRLLAAIGGGVMAGWGMMIWWLAGEPLRRMPELVLPVIRNSVLVWFAVDGLASLAAGAPLNVVANLAFLAMLLWPVRALSAARAGAANA